MDVDFLGGIVTVLFTATDAYGDMEHDDWKVHDSLSRSTFVSSLGAI